ncbi:hypothetical protein LPJ55_003414 [Coemansia sp. RSA 990]|nr:hypothetical protein LPJ68_002547 [Coemansia sp. RSA 1086]KAJ1748722.1 hypothetical protein LPJ79_004313 [Coemansia sp. RSA 1821]KAJ1872041.1 hypothetical protein LPJ55_003414 [Coemansia sp. RSA 990]
MDYTKCDNSSDFEAKFRSLLAKLDVAEGEETWQQIDTALKNLTLLVKAGATTFDTFLPTIKQAIKPINTSVLSERTRLSASALGLIEELSRQMDTRFQALSEQLFGTTMKLCGRANKVFITRGVNCLTTVITYSHVPEQTPLVCNAILSDPSKTMRASAAKLLMSLVSCCTVPELNSHMALVEKAIAAGIVDANPDARTTARQTYEIFVKRFSDRVEQFHAGLSTTAKKYLKINDKTGDSGQSRVAAFRQRQPLRDRIAAQRAKVSANGQSKPPEASAGPQRPRPVRPITKPGPAAVRRDGTSAAAAAAAAVVTLDNPANSSKTAALEPPAMTSKTNSLDNVLMSPRSSKPTLMRLFGEEDAVATKTAEKSPQDSARASAAESAEQSRAPTPDKAKAESEDTAPSSKTLTPPSSGDESSSQNDGAKKGPVKAVAQRAKRGHGLSFSSLNSANGGRTANAPHPVRPQSRNLVSSRMEEALRSRPVAQKPKATRAERPASRASVAPKRMTLRSDTRGSGPGYLRATASSSKRTADTALATRGTKRRKAGDTPDTAAKAVKTGPRRRSAGKK